MPLSSNQFSVLFEKEFKKIEKQFENEEKRSSLSYSFSFLKSGVCKRLQKTMTGPDSQW